jgi:hypothetical protein
VGGFLTEGATKPQVEIGVLGIEAGRPARILWRRRPIVRGSGERGRQDCGPGPGRGRMRARATAEPEPYLLRPPAGPRWPGGGTVPDHRSEMRAYRQVAQRPPPVWPRPVRPHPATLSTGLFSQRAAVSMHFLDGNAILKGESVGCSGGHDIALLQAGDDGCESQI